MNSHYRSLFSPPEQWILTTACRSHYQSNEFSQPEQRILTAARCSHNQSNGISLTLAVLTIRAMNSHDRSPFSTGYQSNEFSSHCVAYPSSNTVITPRSVGNLGSGSSLWCMARSARAAGAKRRQESWRSTGIHDERTKPIARASGARERRGPEFSLQLAIITTRT